MLKYIYKQKIKQNKIRLESNKKADWINEITPNKSYTKFKIITKKRYGVGSFYKDLREDAIEASEKGLTIPLDDLLKMIEEEKERRNLT